jgi:hypothetical protein
MASNGDQWYADIHCELSKRALSTHTPLWGTAEYPDAYEEVRTELRSQVRHRRCCGRTYLTVDA